MSILRSVAASCSCSSARQGAGRQLLISVIAAILDQDSGNCEVLGRDLQHMSQSERAHFRGVSIGFVFQLFNLLPALTAIENVAIPLLINGISRRRAEARAREVLEAVGSRYSSQRTTYTA